METPLFMGREAAQELVSPYVSRLLRCLQVGPKNWGTLIGTCPAECKDLDRSIAVMLYEWITKEIEREFEQDAPNVYVRRAYGSLRLNILDLLIARFNKGDPQGRPYRNRTRVTRGFYGQGVEQLSFLNETIRQLGLPGINQPTNVNLLWLLDPSATQIKNVLISCPFGKQVVWSFSILSPTEVVVVPELNAQPETPSRGATVRPKVDKVQDEDQQSS